MTFGLANPAGAAALLAVAVLIALWLWERRRRVIPVGALFLWERVPPQPLERRRFRPDLIFLLQLAALLALCGAYVAPYLQAPPVRASARTALVLDVSASMQAREADGRTRFATARARAARLLDDAGDGEFLVVTAAARARVALPWTRDVARARATLDALAPLDTPTNLAPAVELALTATRATPAARVVVVTDLAPAASGVPADVAAAVDWLQVGRTDDNVGIAGITVEPTPFAGVRGQSATVFVRNYAAVPRTVVVDARVDDAPWARHVLTLPARDTAPLLLRSPPRAGRLDVALGVDDALAVDDRASAWIGDEAPLDAVVVTESPALGATFRAIAAAAGGRAEVVNRARWEEEPLGAPRVVLFDGYVPAVPADANALYVAPPPGNAVCPAERTIEGATVVDWDASHPLLAAVEDVGAIDVGRASRLVAPAWGRAVVVAVSRGAPFPLLVAGERDGRRIACFGAELAAPLDASDRLPVLLLVLATMRWLAAAPDAAVLETGVPATLGWAPASGAGLVVGGEPAIVVAERAGVWRAGARTVIANLADERESDIGRDPRDHPGRASVAMPTVPGARRPLGAWLLAAAAVALVAEWLAWGRREGA